MHHGSISPCEGADPEGKEEGAGNQIKSPRLKYYNHERNTLNSLWNLCYHYLQEKLKREKGGIPSDATKKNEKEEPIILRPLNMSDLKEAKNQVSPSFLI